MLAVLPRPPAAEGPAEFNRECILGSTYIVLLYFFRFYFPLDSVAGFLFQSATLVFGFAGFIFNFVFLRRYGPLLQRLVATTILFCLYTLWCFASLFYLTIDRRSQDVETLWWSFGGSILLICVLNIVYLTEMEIENHRAIFRPLCDFQLHLKLNCYSFGAVDLILLIFVNPFYFYLSNQSDAILFANIALPVFGSFQFLYGHLYFWRKARRLDSEVFPLVQTAEAGENGGALVDYVTLSGKIKDLLYWWFRWVPFFMIFIGSLSILLPWSSVLGALTILAATYVTA